MGGQSGTQLYHIHAGETGEGFLEGVMPSLCLKGD